MEVRGAGMIDGVWVRPLRQIPDERGKIMHMLRCDDPNFEQFGEIYFSTIYPGVIKGWHLHKEMTLNYAVVFGMIKLVLYDDRPGSVSRDQFQEVFVGDSNYVLIRIPPGVWNGYKGLGMVPAIVANCATQPHDPAEIVRRDPFNRTIDYDWGVRHR